MYAIFKSAQQVRTRQTAQEQNSDSARSARCYEGPPGQILLTQREQQIANLVAAGLSNKQIAREASIAEGTVKAHLHNAYQKLSVSNRTSLALTPTGPRGPITRRSSSPAWGFVFPFCSRARRRTTFERTKRFFG